MNTDVKQNTLLHYTMSYIGGLFAIYSLLEHSNVFGSAETSNMILLVHDLLYFDYFHIIIRVGSLIVYALGIILTLWMSQYHPNFQKLVCIIIDCIATIILGLLPNNITPVIALYPVAFAMSIQWCTFKGIQENSSATTFSTGNFRQLITAIFNYITKKDASLLHRIKFYVFTMLSFHTGIATIYLLYPHISHHSIWLVFIPLACALVQELAILNKKEVICEMLNEDAGCEDV